MEPKSNISDYRSKLDNTLASPELTNYETIHTLVKNQILQSSGSQLEEYTENVVEKRSKEMFNFLGMLRSASVTEKSIDESQTSWKIKQDTDEYRVMYREGEQGTPFHTLLVEGYVDGPLDVCLCISCESDLYRRWWPQSVVPTFKVVSSQCVQNVRVGEQISLVRMKVSWPLSSREALVHYFTLEYFKDGLIVVLLNTISDLESIDKSTHGFTREGIPDAEDVVRIDVVGGFAIQKVTADRSYFRTIANMDIKLDFVPPAFINFVSRQLIGSGFKLYKKEITSVSKGDEKFREALKDPMYTRIHEALYSKNTPLGSPALQEQNPEAHGDNNRVKENNDSDDRVVIDLGAGNALNDRKVPDEITELDDIITNEIIEEEVKFDVTNVVTSNEVKQDIRTSNDIKELFGTGIKNKVSISPEVRRALGTLEKAISMLRGYNSNFKKGNSDEENGEELIISLDADETGDSNGARVESPVIGSIDSHGSRHKGSNSYAKETNQSKIAPDEGPLDSHSSVKQITVIDDTTVNYSLNDDANSTKEESAAKTKNRKTRFCCFVGEQEAKNCKARMNSCAVLFKNL
ncbi:hypothetical protein CASFOL_013599 [Castilleja foliolosa]|uniref:START domain-containing protein n=1 Tax=Castilleja foliolosa TaxID=1961234 RepID=A0ABD3DP19_9LAMI